MIHLCQTVRPSCPWSMVDKGLRKCPLIVCRPTMQSGGQLVSLFLLVVAVCGKSFANHRWVTKQFNKEEEVEEKGGLLWLGLGFAIKFALILVVVSYLISLGMCEFNFPSLSVQLIFEVEPRYPGKISWNRKSETFEVYFSPFLLMMSLLKPLLLETKVKPKFLFYSSITAATTTKDTFWWMVFDYCISSIKFKKDHPRRLCCIWRRTELFVSNSKVYQFLSLVWYTMKGTGNRQ